MFENLVLVVFLAFGCVEYARSAQYVVNNSNDFYAKLKLVKPGDTIILGNVTFDGRTSKALAVKGISGTADKPIKLVGSAKTVITNRGYGFHVENSNYWIFESKF
jgi:hypothetical protein